MLNEAWNGVEGAAEISFALIELFEGGPVVIAKPIVGGLACVRLGAPWVSWHVAIVPAPTRGKTDTLKVALVVLQKNA